MIGPKKIAAASILLLGVVVIAVTLRRANAQSSSKVDYTGTSAYQTSSTGLMTCGPDCDFQMTSTGSTSTVNNFGHTFMSAPFCFAQPQADMGSGNRYWVNTSTTEITITTSSATSISWFVHCQGI